MKTPEEKAEFVREFMRNMTQSILAKVEEMPPEWDGHELRRYIADKFTHEIVGKEMRDGRSARYRNYINTIRITNL